MLQSLITYEVIPTAYMQEGVRFTHPDLREILDKYITIYDVLKGSSRVKEQRSRYLPIPNASDDSFENSERYGAYLTRAVFYNATGRTQKSLVGQVFSTAPIINLPESLDVLGSNENGKFITLSQIAKAATSYALAYGRTGVFVDYPQIDSYVTVAESKLYKPIFRVYAPWDIVNWKISVQNNTNVVSLLVLREKILVSSGDPFYQSYGERYRVLELVNGEYHQSIYESTIVGGELEPISSFIPRDHRGLSFDYIPFKFIGAVNNDSDVDDPPLYDLAEVNLAHYRNSADYEEGNFICGQPTLVMSGLTQDWVSTVFKDKPILLGARSAIPLPVNADAKLMQAQANSVLNEAMDRKEKQMVALGAKLIERSVARTAFETAIDKAGDMSVLADIALNVTAAFTQALQIAAAYVGADTSGLVFSLTTNFEFTSMSNQDRLALIQEYQSEVISWSEARHVLRRGGIATQDDKSAKKEIELNPPSASQQHLVGGDVTKKNVEPNKDNSDNSKDNGAIDANKA